MVRLCCILAAAALSTGPFAASAGHYGGQWTFSVIGTMKDLGTGQVWHGSGASNILVVIKGKTVSQSSSGMLDGSFDPRTGIAHLRYVYRQGQPFCPVTIKLVPWTNESALRNRPPAGTGKAVLHCIEHVPTMGSGTWRFDAKVTAKVLAPNLGY